MKIHQFLSHYDITDNPFSQEDAAADRVFRDHCLNGTHHSAWDKIFGDPGVPSTSVVFGEQGSGKTALRLQIVSRLREHNAQNPEQRTFIVQYEDFNPFLDCFRERLSGRKRRPDRALQNWRLWDHMDGILTLAVTRLADTIRNDGKDPRHESANITTSQLGKLTRSQKRDILLMAAFYDANREHSEYSRWTHLRRKLKFTTWKSYWDWGLGLLVTFVTLALVIRYSEEWATYFSWWIWLVILCGWLPLLWRQLKCWWSASRVKSQIRVTDHHVSSLRAILASFEQGDLIGQPIPSRARGDDRYAFIERLQSVLKTLGFDNIVVLIDRVDEPHLVHGSPERIRDLIWPLFDNKFLKHPDMAFKMLLPSTVAGYLNRQEKEFYERSRLDKQNLIPSLSWTGQGLYDVANDRLRGCTKNPESTVTVKDLFAENITEQELITTFDRLRAPRHLFKFLYRLLIDHCSKYTEDSPEWKIQRETLQSSLALFMRDLENYDQKLGTG